MLIGRCNSRVSQTKPSYETELQNRVTKPSYETELRNRVTNRVTKPSYETELQTDLQTRVTKPSYKTELCVVTSQIEILTQNLILLFFLKFLRVFLFMIFQLHRILLSCPKHQF